MRKFNVNVNGTAYEVMVEEITGAAASAPAAVAAPVPAAAPATAAPVASVPAGGEKILSPMPGNILAVNVSVGQVVKKSEVLMILEAMKMENEIMAPRDGKIASVNTEKGATVNSGDVLAVIE